MVINWAARLCHPSPMKECHSAQINYSDTKHISLIAQAMLRSIEPKFLCCEDRVTWVFTENGDQAVRYVTKRSWWFGNWNIRLVFWQGWCRHQHHSKTLEFKEPPSVNRVWERERTFGQVHVCHAPQHTLISWMHDVSDSSGGVNWSERAQL